MHQTEFWLRLAASGAFGLSILASVILLRRLQAQVWLHLSHAFFWMGTLLLFSELLYKTAVSGLAGSELVSLGMATILALGTLVGSFRFSQYPAFTFLPSALVFLLLVFVPFFTSEAPSVSSTPSWIVTLHVVTAIIGEALCLMAFGSSLIYLWTYRQLKKVKMVHTKLLYPPLDVVDKLVGRTSFIGLVFITTSLLSGLVLVRLGLGNANLTKVIWAFAVWIWYILSIYGRESWGWRGKKGAYVALLGLAMLALTLFGTLGWETV